MKIKAILIVVSAFSFLPAVIMADLLRKKGVEGTIEFINFFSKVTF